MIIRCSSCGANNRVPAARLADTPRCGRCHQGVAQDKPVPIASVAEFDELVSASPLPVLVDFWAAWCGPCRVVAPELEKLARSRAGRALVAKVDTEALPEIAARYGIQSIPTFITFSRGREAARAMGAMSSEQLAQRLGV